MSNLPRSNLPRTNLTVTEQAAGIFVVQVSAGGKATTHRVEVPTGLAEQIGGPGTTDDRLVEESFHFLLERESNTSILRSFTIDVIGSYFPEWRSEMAKQLAR